MAHQVGAFTLPLIFEADPLSSLNNPLITKLLTGYPQRCKHDLEI